MTFCLRAASALFWIARSHTVSSEYVLEFGPSSRMDVGSFAAAPRSKENDYNGYTCQKECDSNAEYAGGFCRGIPFNRKAFDDPTAMTDLKLPLREISLEMWVKLESHAPFQQFFGCSSGNGFYFGNPTRRAYEDGFFLGVRSL